MSKQYIGSQEHFEDNVNGYYDETDRMNKQQDKEQGEQQSEQANYMQVVEQTPEEEFDMYMSQPKEDLVKMLLNCQSMLKEKFPTSITSSNTWEEVMLAYSKYKSLDLDEVRYMLIPLKKWLEENYEVPAKLTNQVNS